MKYEIRNAPQNSKAFYTLYLSGDTQPLADFYTLGASFAIGNALELARRVAALNPDAGEIGAGMLADLVQRARAIVGTP